MNSLSATPLNVNPLNATPLNRNPLSAIPLSATLLSATLLSVTPLNATPLSAIPLKCVSMNNQECKIRPQLINVNTNEPIFYPYSIKINKCSGSCNSINYRYARLCVPDTTKNIMLKYLI